MTESRLTALFLRLGAGLTLAFIYVPLILIGLYAFNEGVTQAWPEGAFFGHDHKNRAYNPSAAPLKQSASLSGCSPPTTPCYAGWDGPTMAPPPWRPSTSSSKATPSPRCQPT